ncbi:MAG: ECF transporter S component [Clostridia bacterium]
MTKKFVYTGVAAALIAVLTMFPAIPNALGGYINLGDSIIIAVSFLLGAWTIPAAGIGAMLADLMLGYTVYAPGTLIIKALVSFTAVMVMYGFKVNMTKEPKIARIIISAICAEIVMVAGYFVYELIVFDITYATGAIVSNLIQAAASSVLAIALCLLLIKTNVKQLLGINKTK